MCRRKFNRMPKAKSSITFPPFEPSVTKSFTEEESNNINPDTIKATDAIFNFIVRNNKTFSLSTAFSLTRNQNIDYQTVAKLWTLYISKALENKQCRIIPSIESEPLYLSNLI